MPWEEKYAAKPHIGEPWSYATYDTKPLPVDVAEVAVMVSDTQRKFKQEPLTLPVFDRGFF